MDDRCRLFVYGTLKPGERAFAQLCEPFVIATQVAQTQGRLYHLPLGYPAMTLESGWVQGALLTFPNIDCLGPIDAFEEYYPDRPQDSEYNRHQHPIYDSQQQPLGAAWIYTMERDRIADLGGQWLPQGYWSETKTF
ncbi:gamma-glutamylcyclotransferase family protein [Nodosilinea sp. E11]|uniref:gamma-glutamylcyclotransferase family protein n=1 Tax=Nodosilinea sp. E11 TaxID=3037479 RepID=UPI00293431E6|nr:gamma-glutamylcyclotransferase family protein [Nodosilinea sp. E11]WOD37807.1 gamma-glutamylcyclotransferase family protein [Nodosilinea sp. E11]